MKQLLFSAVLLLFSISVFAQATPVGELRVADATTAAFGVNVPIGTKIFNYGTGQYWVATAAIVSTKKLSDAISDGSVTLINANEQAMTASVAAGLATVNLSKTTLTTGAAAVADAVTIGTTGSSISISANGANGIMITTAEQQALGYTESTTIGTVGLSGGESTASTAVIPAASAAKAGLMTAAQWSTLFGPTDPAPTTGILTVETFVQAADVVTATEFDIASNSKLGMSILVSLNGVELPLNNAVGATSGYAFTAGTKHVHINVPTIKYDQVVVTYNK